MHISAAEYRKMMKLPLTGGPAPIYWEAIVENEISGPAKNVKIRNAQKTGIDGQAITDLEAYRKKFPEAPVFDSRLEYYGYQSLIQAKILFVLKPVYILQAHFYYLGAKVNPITMIADFLLPDHQLIVDTKGYANDVYPVKAKLLMHHLRENPHQLIVLKNKTEVDAFIYKLLNSKLAAASKTSLWSNLAYKTLNFS